MQSRGKSVRQDAERSTLEACAPQYSCARLNIAVCVFLAALCWIVFSQTVRHDFINYDDPTYVYQNAQITAGLNVRSVGWAFTHVHAENWHPLTTISHMLDCQSFGLQPGWHHVINVLLHGAGAVLLFILLEQMTGGPSRTGNIWASGFVAAVFAIHPLRVESVAWIAERKDVLSGVFFMLTLISYVRYIRQPSLGRYITMSILFACGLMSKPMLVTTPIVLLLLDYWPLDRVRGPAFAKPTARQAEVGLLRAKAATAAARGQKPEIQHARSTTPKQSGLAKTFGVIKLFTEKIPLFALSIGSCAVTLLVQQQSVGSTEQLPVALRIENAFVSYVIYLRQMFWPTHLAPFYPHPEKGLPFPMIIGSAALLIAITAIAFALRRRCPYLLTGWLWYAVMLVPVIGIIQVGWQARADRYTYLPQIGLYLGITWAIVDLSASWRNRREILAVTAVALIAILSWRAWIQTSYWKNNQTLWTHTLAVTEDNDVAENNLGTVLFQRGLIDEALSRFQIATNLRPRNAAAQDNLARTLRRKGRISEAIAHSREALELQPNKIETRNMLGAMLFQEGQVEAAISQWREVLARQPDNYAQNSLAWVLATYPESSIRDGATAVELARQALELSGGKNATVLRTLAAAYAESGRFSEAIETAQRGMELATAQSDFGLVDAFQREIALYRDGFPLRAQRPSIGDSPP
jgi:Flp pilus assembly protein TadD